jgi:hypothetical protein
MKPLYIIAEEDFRQLLEKLKYIEANIISKQVISLAEQWLDNDQLMQMLCVSRRTLQNWRDTGLIAFSQIGSKIYYRYTDVEQMLQNHKQQPFRVA